MKLFVDTADINEIREIAAWGVLAGATTNPSLLAQVEGSEDEIYRSICETVNGPVSAEVVADEPDLMISEGTRLAAIHPDIVVKLPTSPEGLIATSALAKKGIRVNMTLCFTASQALLAAAAGAAFVSPFVGRYDDIGNPGLEALRDVVDALMGSAYDCEVLAASIRSPIHVQEAAKMGADIATIPPKVFHQMLRHPLTDAGNAKFNEDAAKRRARNNS
ncbi:MAG: fructose-6-phosphate aldolase [Thermoleophilia bacterium]|nr:fructose-6-phosphate aldolase [Thermoleophilia bacterium]